MTQDDIIVMAVNAGFKKDWIFKVKEMPDFLERFAKLAFEKGRQQGMKQENALSKMAETSRDIGYDK